MITSTNIFDVHTHHQCATGAIINTNPQNLNFKPSLLYSIGIHPWWIENSSEKLISSLSSIVESHGNIVAIGECGIDKLISAPLCLQQDIFAHHISISESLGLPVIVHCVRAWQELIYLHSKYAPSQPWVIHGFRGKPSVLRMVINEGMYVSYGEHFNEESLRLTPHDRILLETDESKLLISDVAAKAASALNVSIDDLVNCTNRNASQIFHLSLERPKNTAL